MTYTYSFDYWVLCFVSQTCGQFRSQLRTEGLRISFFEKSWIRSEHSDPDPGFLIVGTGSGFFSHEGLTFTTSGILC